MKFVEYEDIVNTEKPILVKIALDGTKVVFVVEKSNIEKNKVINILYVWDKKISLANLL